MTDSSPKYYREEPVLGKQVKELFRQYVGIQKDDEIVRHITEIVWSSFLIQKETLTLLSPDHIH